MKSLLLLGICTFAWLAWIPAALGERLERGERGGVSFIPIIPFYPLLAWLAGLGLNHLEPDLGLYLVGGLHVVLAVVFLGSAVRSEIRIKAKKG
jgi:hypothetical protein